MKGQTDPKLDCGEKFQHHTKYLRETIGARTPEWEEKPGLYKQYPQARRLSLPEPSVSGGAPLWTVVASRRSFREFPHRPLDLAAVSQLLWASQGITGRAHGFEFRSAPSAGALYPVETYLVFNRVEGAESGLYHYHVPDHSLELLRQGSLGDELMQAGLMQPSLADCAACFAWTAVIKRSSWKYCQRAYRYIYLDAGHIAQNLVLAAESLDLGACLIGALFDDEVNGLLGVDGKTETILYMCAVGPR